jgi:thiol-disulfide isomerase/thioredoxin
MRRLIIVTVALAGLSGSSAPCFAQEASGVGIALGRKGEDFIVAALLSDGSAAASHAIHVGDRIIAVAQEDEAEVRVKGLKLEDVVRRVRGPKGTSVCLTIVPANQDDTHAHVVNLVRGELKELAGWGDGALLKKGSKAPAVRFTPLDGKPEERSADYLGKIVVLEFWSIGCGPCQRKMADLQSYPDMYPNWKDDVALISINAVNDDLDAVRKHVKAKGWNRTHNVRAGADAMKAFHVNSLPTVYVIDRRGNVVASDNVLDIPEIVNKLIHKK